MRAWTCVGLVGLAVATAAAAGSRAESAATASPKAVAEAPPEGHVAETAAAAAPSPVAKSATAATGAGQAETARRAAPSWFALVVGVAVLAVGLLLVLAIVTALLVARASKRRRPHDEQPTQPTVPRTER